uniref:Uncharacterized protein n=1 Tax=Kalanchoe fedtschenkoi TaxID=63787 RepID=A0A7N0VIF5_KALFE
MRSHFQAAGGLTYGMTMSADHLKAAKLAMARRELEELYMGVPDESVNLTFQHLADVHCQVTPPPPSSNLDINIKPSSFSASHKLPSLDFQRAMQVSRPNHYHHHQSPSSLDKDVYNLHHHHPDIVSTPMDSATIITIASARASSSNNNNSDYNMMNMHNNSGKYHTTVIPGPVKNSMKKHQEIRSSSTTAPPPAAASDNDMLMRRQYITAGNNKHIMKSPPAASGVGHQGIPHSKICAICDTYVYVFRHRCLVCGRVYCRNCVNIGMGEMSEGRKCVECLGRRFSQRYIERAGKMQAGCCWSYPDNVKQQEVKWAQKGPRLGAASPKYDRSSSIIMVPGGGGDQACLSLT